MMEKNIDKRFTVMATLFCVCLVVSNMFEVKIFHLGALMLTGGFVMFPITYILNDCITEIYGYRRMRFVIYLAFGINLFIVLMSQLIILLPSSPTWEGGGHFNYVFRLNSRIFAASALAFVAGSILNSKVMSRMKEIQGAKGFGWRSTLSSFIGQTADSVIFFPIAFLGYETRYLITIMVTQIILKTAYTVVALPLTSLVVKRSENWNGTI